MGFLFLSKLLPLFLYPLGLSCCLLVLALFLLWKKSRWSAVPVAIALAVLFIAGNSGVKNIIFTSLEEQYLPSMIPQAQAIVVLGGATYPLEKPRRMAEINESGDRLLYSVKLYQDQKAPLIIASGGRVAWNGEDQSKGEAQDMASLMVMMGVPQTAIVLEPKSLNTYQNAVNVKQILEEKNINEIILVTSAFHMPRAIAIFQKLGITAYPAPTDFLVDQADREPSTTIQDFILDSFPQADNIAFNTKALKEYIGHLIYRFKGWI
jgi:uncharacterized SAM-binding protein YcdF (DUF218 family)